MWYTKPPLASFPNSRSYVRTLVVDMCFLIEGKTDEELPVSRALGVPLIVPAFLTIIPFTQERLIGTSRVAHLEPDSAVAPPPLE